MYEAINFLFKAEANNGDREPYIGDSSQGNGNHSPLFWRTLKERLCLFYAVRPDTNSSWNTLEVWVVRDSLIFLFLWPTITSRKNHEKHKYYQKPAMHSNAEQKVDCAKRESGSLTFNVRPAEPRWDVLWAMQIAQPQDKIFIHHLAITEELTAQKL